MKIHASFFIQNHNWRIIFKHYRFHSASQTNRRHTHRNEIQALLLFNRDLITYFITKQVDHKKFGIQLIIDCYLVYSAHFIFYLFKSHFNDKWCWNDKWIDERWNGEHMLRFLDLYNFMESFIKVINDFQIWW